MGSLGYWMQQQWRTYVGNATSVRDYRVQMRGPRSVMLFGVYLFVLILVALWVYGGVAERDVPVSVSTAQASLKQFYVTVMSLLAFMIVSVTPALSATAIVTERQRRSLDLIFSAPVTPKYFLVGKLIAAFRYTWMLLVLSLPVTATCVVLGGSSWQDVLIAYLLLSLSGLVFTSLALCLSTTATSTVAAIFIAYVGTGAYLLFTFLVGLATSTSLLGMTGSNEAAVWMSLNPFLAVVAAPTHTILWGNPVANWILAIPTTVLVCHVLLLAAGSSLAPAATPITRNLRIFGLAYGVILSWLLGTSVTSARSLFGSAGLSPTQGATQGLQVMCLCLPIILPYLTIFGWDGEQRRRPDGLARISRAFKGTPSGGLPYLYMLLASIALGTYLGATSVGTPLAMDFFRILGYEFGLWTMFWALGRLISTSGQHTKSAMLLHFIAMAGVLALPPILFAAIDESKKSWGVWDLYFLRPLTEVPDRPVHTIALTVFFFVIGFVLTIVSERRRANLRLPAYLQVEPL